MTKNDLILLIADRTQQTQKIIEQIIDAYHDIIVDVLCDGDFSDKINITNFGTFSVSQRNGREGRDPRSGEKKLIPASRNVHFKASKKIKEKLNQ